VPGPGPEREVPDGAGDETDGNDAGARRTHDEQEYHVAALILAQRMVTGAPGVATPDEHPRKTEVGQRAEIPARDGARVPGDRVRLHYERDDRDDQRRSQAPLRPEASDPGRVPRVTHVCAVRGDGAAELKRTLSRPRGGKDDRPASLR